MSDNCYWVGEKGVTEECTAAPTGPPIPPTGNFIQRAALSGPTGGTYGFGSGYDNGGGVAIDGETAMISYPDGTDSLKFKVKVYTRTGDNWALTDTLTSANDLVAQGVSGDYAVFTTFIDNGGGDVDSGIYIYKRSGPGTWIEAHFFLNENVGNVNISTYGAAISPDGEWVMVNRTDSTTPASDPGKIQVYNRTGTTYSFSSIITGPYVGFNKNFGNSIAISNAGYAVVGEQRDDAAGTNMGVAHIYTLGGSTWTLDQTLAKASYASSDLYGTKVGISADATKVVVSDDRGNTEVWDGGPGTYVRDQLVNTGPIGASMGTAMWDDGLTMVRASRPSFGQDMDFDVVELSGTWGITQSIIPALANINSIDLGIIGFDAKDGQIIVEAYQDSFGNRTPEQPSTVFIYSR
jgi:hypothetical protein